MFCLKGDIFSELPKILRSGNQDLKATHNTFLVYHFPTRFFLIQLYNYIIIARSYKHKQKHKNTSINVCSTNVEKCILSIEFLSGALPVETCCGLRRSKIKYDSRTMKLFIQHVSRNFSWAINNGKLFFGRKAAPTRSGIWHIFLHSDVFYFGYSILNYCT